MGIELLAVPLGVSLFSFCVLALIINAFSSFVTYASTYKRYTAKQMLISLTAVFANALAAGGGVFVSVIRGIIRWWIFIMAVVLVFSCVNVTFNEYPSVWTGSVRFYNRYMGPFIHIMVTVPLYMVDILLRALLPLWDSVVWFGKALLVQGLLPVVLDEVETVLQMATTIFHFVIHLVAGLFWFIESFFCEGIACVHPESGVLDILSCLGDVREFVALSIRLVKNFCGIFAAPLDLMLYPLLDINLAEGVHNLVNSVVQLLMVIPKAATTRCFMKEDNQFDLLMCTPDLAPFFNFMAAGFSSLGLAVDNWLNIAFVIVEQFLTGSSPTCDILADVSFPERLGYGLFPVETATTVVGLTDWLYAVTDGVHAYYLAHNDGTKTKTQPWPFSVDPAMGIAAVTYSKVHDLDVSAFSSGKTAGSMQTTAMLGCNCSDDLVLGMQILCAILPMSGIPTSDTLENYRIQVLFPTTDTALLYRCAGVDLYVKSVRWSFTRYETVDASLGSTSDKTTLPTHDCIARGTCRELDATVWLVPRCGQDVNLNAETACIDVAPCFPFCMAARSAGSGRDNLVLSGARRWREGLTILSQDCALDSGSPGTVQAGVPSRPTVSMASGTPTGLLQAAGVGVFGFSYADTNPICRHAPGVTSMISKDSRAKERVMANVALTGQPFAITGDTLMSSVRLGGDAFAVQVERLEGSEVDVFSLHGINQHLPALPMAVVPLEDVEAAVLHDKLNIPYNYGTTRIASVNSRNYLFYASNPNADALGAYFQYCHDMEDPNKLAKFGILIKSSYSRIRIYRVKAYKRCAAYSCGPDLVTFVGFDGFSGQMSKACDEVFNSSVMALEYLNEDNIAVTVQAAYVKDYDSNNGGFSPSVNTTTKTYWLNPTSMRLSATIWQTTIPSSATAVLCPSMQRLPRVGSFMAELLNSGVFLLKFVFSSVLYTPGLMTMWRVSRTCPIAGGSMYHSVLANCGERVYSLDDFFDSVDDAGAIFWHSLSLIATLLSPSDPTIAEPFTRVMNGMSQYGQGTIDLWAAKASVLTLTRVPVKDQITQIWATVQSGLAPGGTGAVQGLAAGGSAVIAWSRYSYRAGSVIVLEILKRVLDPTINLDFSTVFSIIFGKLYDLREEFDATVSTRTRLGCSGVRLMFGVGNPWSELVYHQCISAAELTRNLMDLTLNIFVKIPMAKCVCKDSTGQNVADYVKTSCAPTLPLTLLPTLYMIANEVQGASRYSNLACVNVLTRVKTDIGTTMDPWFDHQFKGLDALASSVEYATASFDAKAGKCLDFQNDPHIVVIVPQPVDYFQRCSGTSRCKQVCSAEWGAFQTALLVKNTGVKPLPAITVTMESMFFPGELDQTLMLTNVSASVELPSSLKKCLSRSTNPPDFSLALAEVAGSSVSVQFWCAPQNAGSSVYRVTDGGYGPLVVPGSIMSLQFGDETGEWLAAMTQMDGAQSIYVLSRTGGVVAAPSLVDHLDADYTLLRVENMWVIEGVILVDMVTRHMTSSTDENTGHMTARSMAQAFHVCLAPKVDMLWRSSPTDLMQFGGGQYWYTKLAPISTFEALQEYIFLPKVPGMLPYKAKFMTTTTGITLTNTPIAMQSTGLTSIAGMLIASRSQNHYYVFATSTVGWDWLKQLRLNDEAISGVFGSANIGVTVNIEGNCNAKSCEGCLDVQTQRLCLAYNKCALINCVGTPVHQRRPLCGIGALLRHNGGMGLVSAQAAWMIFAEMLSLSLQMSLLSLREARLLWPEDAFLCYVCQAKDRSAEFFSILTATVNSALQLGDANVGFMYGGASNVDTNADVVLTISSTALNAFLHQVALFPIYFLVVSHQIVMCEVTGVIALMGGSGFILSLKPAGESSASDIMAGQCLTAGAETMANYPTDSPSSLGFAVTSLSANVMQTLYLMQIEPFLHALDGVLAYFIGVVQSFGGVIMSQNAARCSPPDFHLKDVVNCACGDHRLQIPPARSMEVLSDSAHWCTGVLGMLDSSNQPYYVYNDFSYAQLQVMSSGLETYTKCVTQVGNTRGYKCPIPNDPKFQAQGVTTLNVLVKCRENFVKKRWDPAAYMLYQDSFWHLLRLKDGAVPQKPKVDKYGVGKCFAEGDSTTGSLSLSCMQTFFLSRKIDADEYWMYERTDTTHPGPEYTDACLVFSGPADKNITIFANCVDGVGSNCTIPQHLWTPLSDNSVPAAEHHRVASHGTNRDGLVQHLYQRAHDMVFEAVKASMAIWDAGGNDRVDISFFSVEGDVLHQTMDCIFMGPYSRVDYWPIPECYDGEECLRGPFWSRDENEGLLRSVNPKTCAAPESLPFTCGSPARKSLMRFLVRNSLSAGMGEKNQNATMIREILLTTLQGIQDDWANTSNYGCDCGHNGGTGPFLPSCCSNVNVSLLSPILNKTFTSLNSTTVLRVLQTGIANFYDQAMENRHLWLEHLEDVAPGEQALYNWSQKQRVEDDARFNPVNPVSSYTSEEEAMSPLLHEDSTLWDACHAALKQVFFTMPVDGSKVRDPDLDATGAFDGDPTRLQEFVKRFTSEAFKHSPLFWHYSPRHAPSLSQMCTSSREDVEQAQGTVSYNDMIQAGTVVHNARDLSDTIPSFHPQRFRVGELFTCLCGWQRTGQRCIPPIQQGTRDSVCALVPCSTGASISYNISSQDVLETAYNPAWFCPEFELSTHWGYMDPVATEAWLGHNQTNLLVTSSRDLFQHGRSGVRAGNLNSLPLLAKTYINPLTREIPLERGRLTTCIDRPPPPEDLIAPFVDDLFPAAQAVDEAGVTAYCVRYTIELARLEVFNLLALPRLENALAKQAEQVETWRRRCGAQLHLLHMCTTLGVYRPPVQARTSLATACPHFKAVEESRPRVIYTTPQCLVSVDNVFYDPCRCVDCAGQRYTTLNLTHVLSRGTACQLRFDPRQVVEQGHPIGWVDGLPPLTDNTLHLLDPERFSGRIMSDPDAVGNVRTGPIWWDTEGPMSENSDFCDGVLDWWDETWDFPVGYHVTVPCEGGDTAYRTFSQAFALNEADMTLVYQHDLLRDSSMADSHFGVGGLCHSGAFGMPMPETNNMRYCTKIQLDDTEDFTLPVQSGADPTDGSAWSDEKCSSSSQSLPWPDMSSNTALYQSTRYSVGTIPNMPSQISTTYPASDSTEDNFKVGPWQEMGPVGHEWGADTEHRCQDFTLRLCLTDAQCPMTGYACRGRVCTQDKTRSCTTDSGCTGLGVCKGVCVDSTLVQCLMHSECPNEKMCSGLGSCVTPVLAVRNLLEVLGENISFTMSTAHDTCGATSTPFSMLEASYWGNTAQDLLRVHGMCSFEDWFKYTESYAKSGCSRIRTSDDTLIVDPSKCNIMDLELSTTNLSRWWPAGNSRPDLMYLRPTGCDRDYERLQGFIKCAPTGASGVLLLPGVSQSQLLEYDRFVRLHENRTCLIMAHMQETESVNVGFLGLNGTVPHISNLADGMEPGPFIPCASVGQCYPAEFTIKGVVSNRSYLDTNVDTWKTYTPQTPFTCGAFGIEDPYVGGCRIDIGTMPLYRFLCVTPIAACTALDVMGIRALCNSIPYTYHASNQDRTRVLNGLRELFYSIPSFDTLDAYFALTACVTELYSQMQTQTQLAQASSIKLSDGFYFPFMFTLYEVPFDWFYQCMVMAGSTVDVTTRTTQDCMAFVTRDKHTIDEYTPVSTTSGDTYDTYLQYLQGGYTISQVNEYAAFHMARATNNLQSARELSRAGMFPHDGANDFSYPRCSKNLLWRIGPYGDPLAGEGFVEAIRAIAWNWNDPQTCQSNWHSRLVQAVNIYGITDQNWVEQLTYPDPWNLIQQGGSGGVTILTIVTNFMILAMSMIILPNVLGGTGGVLVFNTELPTAYDFTKAPVPTSLIPEYSVDGGTIMMDDTVNRTCVFLPNFDPAFANMGVIDGCGAIESQIVTDTRTDRLRKCGQKMCTSIPVAYKRDGRFSCRYIAESVIPTTCTESQRGCHLEIVTKIYEDVYKKYLTFKGTPPPVLRPEKFAWFSRTWTFNGFNLQNVLDYERNIQPNPERTVMCEITTNAASAIKFTTCNNPHYEKLKTHVEKFYKHNGAVQIPAGAQLEWEVSRSILNKGVILSYSNMNKPLRQRYMDALFDSETVCRGEAKIQVCRKDSTTTFKSINPWLMGKFNPYEVCDVEFTDPGEGGREYIYSDCLKAGNTACDSFSRKEIPSKCNANHNTLVTKQGVPRYTNGIYVDYNLCHHRLEEDAEGCMHDQGLLGGFDGLPIGATLDTATSMIKGSKWETYSYKISTNLYTNSTWDIPDDFRADFFSLANPLWQGKDAPYGHLQIPETGIGGHRIGLSISRANTTTDIISTMKVARISLGLGENKKFIDDPANLQAGKPVSEWVPGLLAAMQAEDADVSGLYQVTYPTNELGFSCPLKRWMFYSADNAAFSPTIPSAQRAKHLFHRIHGGLVAHPTMKRVAKGAFLGRYTTSNGFCACPVLQDVSQPQCRIPISAGFSHACSLTSTMSSLKGDTWLYSHVYPPLDNERATKKCSMLLDWPAVDGVMRDGSPVTNLWTKASSTTHKECHILDRFIPFKYKYTAATTLKASGKNTVSHGVCKTERAVTLDRTKIPSTANARCLRLAMDYSGARFTCNTSSVDGLGNPWMARRVALTVPQMLSKRATRRTKCSACSSTPRFKSEAGENIQPESSFGRLHRLSVERLLAKDLMDALCETPDCGGLLNRSAWKRREFMINYMTSPHLLFMNHTTPRNAGSKSAPAPEPASQWTEKPWVYCPTPESLKTGEGCQGTMSRSAWIQEKTRICPAMVRSFSASSTNSSQGDPMVRTPFCSIDNTTNKVCLAVAEARLLVIKANCIARGDMLCMPQPFVYHPASYEPSNNAWIHDSVQSFYTRISKTACDAATAAETQSLLDFARVYQRGCPANAVNLMVGILQIVRVVATEVALVSSAFIGMMVKVLGLFFTGSGSDMKPYIAADWQYIKTKSSTLMQTEGDMLVDALLNSGELGARLMGFFQRTCNRINSGISWFFNVWCNYIQQYMIQVLSGLRHAMGIMGAGFDMLQDFMDEVFQGVLPAAFVAKYAQSAFQDLLVESYSQPTEHKDKVKSKNKVPDTVNPRPKSRLASARNSIGRVFSFGRSPIGKALGMMGYAGAAFGLITGIMDLVDEIDRRKLWPANFTLFDLKDVVNTLDDMERFLLLDESCYEFQLYADRNQSYNVFPCPNLQLSSYAATTAGTTSFVATQCWADARPSLGQNSLFACSTASTCCKTTECLEFIMCSSCAEPQLGGVNQYGCDSLRKKCVCGQAVISHDRCSSNRQCDLDSQCDLVSALNSVSYGTIPCANCPGTARLMCLLPTTGFPGRCACMLDSVRGYDLCSDLSGMLTSVDGNRLCAYLQGPTPTTWVFDMEDLIMVPCTQVKTGVCSTVMQGGVSLQMVVAKEVTATFSGRRRILSVDEVIHDPGPPTYDAYESEYELTDSQALHDLLMDAGWNTTAAPCSTLALAYQGGVKLGILETHVLHKCGFWRYVGRRVIQIYNMTVAMEKHETFLLSMDDMIYALMSPAVVAGLLQNPEMLGTALLYHPWLKPVRALGVAIANQVEHLKWIRDIEADVHEHLFGDGPPPEKKEEEVKIISPRFKREPPQNISGKRGRMLLSVQTSINAVAAYSAQIIQNPNSAGQVPSIVAGAWSTTAFSWPPRYDYHSLNSCPLAQSILQLAWQAVMVNKMYYDPVNFNRPKPKIDRSLRANLPKWTWINNITTVPGSSKTRSWPSNVFHWMLDQLSISPSHLIAFFLSEKPWSIQWILQTALQCDLASVVTCSRHENDLLMSHVVFLIIFLLIVVVVGPCGMGGLAVVFFVSYPWFILWYTFGMAPSCFPMLPPCLLGDIVSTVSELVPPTIVFPSNLRCDAEPRTDMNQTCLRSCSELNFTTWADPLVFAICDTDPATCTYFKNMGGSGFGVWDSFVGEPLHKAVTWAHAVVMGGDLAGHRMCTWITFIDTVPVLLVLGLFTVLISALFAAFFELVPPLIMFLGQLYVYSEAR